MVNFYHIYDEPLKAQPKGAFAESGRRCTAVQGRCRPLERPNRKYHMTEDKMKCSVETQQQPQIANCGGFFVTTFYNAKNLSEVRCFWLGWDVTWGEVKWLVLIMPRSGGSDQIRR
jgi:hypothetical protein